MRFSCGRDDRRPLGNGCGCSVAPPSSSGWRSATRTGSVAFDADRAFFRSYNKAGKTKRLRNGCVEVAPAIFRGKPTGAVLHARARLLDGEEARLAAGGLARRRRLLQGCVVPLAHG